MKTKPKTNYLLSSGVVIVTSLLAILAGPKLLFSATPEESTTGEVPERHQLDPQTMWDLTHMYESIDAWEKNHNEIDALIDAFSKLEGTIGQSPENLEKALNLRDQIGVQLDRLYAYASHMFDQDLRESGPQALKDRAQTLGVKYGEKSSWWEPELLKIPRETLESWLDRESLKIYDHYFDDLFRQQEHILSPREEQLLAMSSKAAGASSGTFSLLTNAELKFNTILDSDGNKITVTSPTYYDLIYSKDRRIRRDVYRAFHNSFLEIKKTLASTLAGAAHRDWFHAKARGYSSCLEASLDRENLPVSVYHNLINTINEHLPLLHRYTALRKRVLKLDEVHPYDLYVNLVDAPEHRYTYEEGKKLILDAIEPMGQEYVDAMRMGFNSGWIDVYENKGKRTGAYCGGTYSVHPYVLLNYRGNYNGVSTVAHEMGHAMQSYFANSTQPPIYADYPMFTAEVASTAAEIVFKRHILSQTTDTLQKAMMIDRLLDDIRQTVFRQTRFAEFDLLIHEMAERGEPITAESLMAKSREIFQKYYGPELVLDPEADVECLRIPHHYYNYYVYRYATSYSAAAAIAQKIMSNDPNAVENWMKFLRTGNSMYALDMLKVAGVDMTTPQPIEDCMALFEDLLDQLENLLVELEKD